jgi:RNA polymerase sigma-70 factor (ECF subfamily)
VPTDRTREEFDDLVRDHAAAIVNLARAMTGSDADADDLAQETFVRAWRGFSRFRGESSVRTWLHGIALNVIRTHRAKRSRAGQLFNVFSRRDAEGEDPLERMAAAGDLERELATRDALDRALATLPADLRETLVLRDVQGLDYREISAVLGVPIGTVESRICRARQRLKPLLEQVRSRQPRQT